MTRTITTSMTTTTKTATSTTSMTTTTTKTGGLVTFDGAIHPELTGGVGTVTGTGAANGWGHAASASRLINADTGITGIAFKCTNRKSHILIGFTSKLDTTGTTSYNSLDYGLCCRGEMRASTPEVYEKGVQKYLGHSQSGSATDEFTIRINTGGTVDYAMNGLVFYTSLRQVVYPWRVFMDVYTSANPLVADVRYTSLLDEATATTTDTTTTSATTTMTRTITTSMTTTTKTATSTTSMTTTTTKTVAHTTATTTTVQKLNLHIESGSDGDWVLVHISGTSTTNNYNLYPVNGQNYAQLASNTGVWASLSEQDMHDLWFSGERTVMKIQSTGPITSRNTFYVQRETNADFSPFHAIRYIPEWSSGSGYKISDAGGYNVSTNTVTMNVNAMGHWEDRTIQVNGATYTVSRHGMPGDVNYWCQWIYDFERRHGPNSCSYCVCGTEDARVITKIYLRSDSGFTRLVQARRQVFSREMKVEKVTSTAKAKP